MEGNQFTRLNRFNGGMEMDSAPGYQQENTVRYNENMRIVNRGGNVYSLEDINGTLASFVSSPDAYPISFLSFNQRMLVFSARVDTALGGYGEIGFVEVNPVTGASTYTALYNDAGLRFSRLRIIRSLYIREQRNIERVYFWDNYNSTRVFDINYFLSLVSNPIASGSLVTGVRYMVVGGSIVHNLNSFGHLSTDVNTSFVATGATYTGAGIVIPFIDPETMAVSPEMSFNTTSYIETITGNLKGGCRYYMHKFTDASGNGGAWSAPSEPVFITQDNINTGADPTSGYQEYQGSDNDAATTKGIRMQIDVVDTRFPYLMIACVKATDEISYETPKIIYFGPTGAGPSQTFDHTSESAIITEFPLAEIIANQVFILRNRDAAAVKNQLAIINYETVVDPAYDIATTATVAPIVKNLLGDILYRVRTDVVLPPAADPLAKDYVNIETDGQGNDLHRGYYCPENGIPENDPTNVENFLYRDIDYYIEGGTSINVITISGGVPTALATGTVFSLASECYWQGSGSEKVYPCVVLNRYGTERKIIPIKKDWHSYKGTAVSHYYRSLWRGETYRFGLMLLKGGIPVYVHHLKDYTVPEIATSDFAEQDSFDYLLRLKALGVRFSNLDFTKILDGIQTLYNDNTIALKDLDDFFDSWMIVRAPCDNQILAEGLLWPVVNHSGGSSRMAQQAHWSIANDENGAAHGRKTDCFVMYSPEQRFLFPEAHSFEEGDNVMIQKYVNLAQTDWDSVTRRAGTLYISSGVHWYNNWYRNNFNYPAAYLTAIGSSNEIEPKWCKHLNSPADSTHYAGTPSLQFFGGVDLNHPTFYAACPSGSGNTSFPGVNNGLTFLFTRFDTAFTNGFGMHDGTVVDNIPYVSYRRLKPLLYGGSSATAKANTIYYPCGHIQSFDADFMAYMVGNAGIVDNVDVFGGDTYINIFDYAHYYSPSNPLNTVDAVTYSSMMSQFPVQSRVNVSFRQGRHVAKDLHYFDVGAGWAGGPISLHPGGLSFPTNGSIDQKEQLVYNRAYSNTQLKASPYVARPENYVPSGVREKSVIISNKKNDGEFTDNWRKFGQGTELNLDNMLGEGVAIRAKNDRLYAWQQDGVSVIPVDERVTINNSLGQPVTLAVQSSIDRFDNIETNRGAQHTHGIVEFPKGFIFFDARRRDLCLLSSGGVDSLSVVKQNHHYFKDYFYGDVGLYDAPLIGKGIFGYYDENFKEVVLNFFGRRDAADTELPHIAVVYNATENHFSHLLTSPSPVAHLHTNNHLFALSPRYDTIAPNTSYALNEVISDSNGVVYICILPFSTGGSPTAPASDTTRWATIGSLKDVHLMHKGDIAKFFGVVQKSRFRIVVRGEGNTSYHFENMRVDTNQDESFFNLMTYTNRRQTVIEKVRSRFYKHIDGMMEFSIPIDDRKESLTGTFLEVEFARVHHTTDPLEEAVATTSDNVRCSVLSVNTYIKRSF